MTEKQTNNAKPARDLLDPKNDYVFKRLFVRAPRLLVALINAVRHTDPRRSAPLYPSHTGFRESEVRSSCPRARHADEA